MSSAEAKDRFGTVGKSAKNMPVFVEQDGRIKTVILSLEQFEKRYSAWMNQHNAQFEEVGLWCDDLRVW
jgi:hypothetical protein